MSSLIALITGHIEGKQRLDNQVVRTILRVYLIFFFFLVSTNVHLTYGRWLSRDPKHR